MDNQLIRKTYKSETKAEEKSRSLIVKISSNTPDRSRDVVMPKGVNLKNYLKNPVVLLSHDYHGLAVAKTVDIQVNDNDITAKVLFPDIGVSPISDTIYSLYKEGFMNAWSIGFMPIKSEDLAEGGKQFNEWELLEFSAVSIPDNPEALTILRSKGIDTTEFEKVLMVKDEVKEEKPVEEIVENKVKKGPACRMSDETNNQCVARKIPEIMAENTSMSRNQAIAIAFSVCKIPCVEDDAAKDIKEIKNVPVISGKSKKMILMTIESLQILSAQLKNLLELSSSDEKDGNVLSLVDALKLADQVVGRALRDYKQGK